MECDKKFRELIDRSFAEEISEGERQVIHDHIRDCDGCKRYVDLTARTIRGLREFTFANEPDSNAHVRRPLRITPGQCDSTTCNLRPGLHLL